MNNKLFLSVLSASLLTPAIVVDVNANAETTIENSFPDVSKNSFAFEAIQELSNKGIISGYPDGQFKPAEVITRGQFAALLGRSLDLPAADSDFNDVPESKALYADISKAYAAGIVLGDTNGNFNPDREVTRADVAVMVNRALQLKGDYTASAELTFADSGSVPRYALESVKRLTHYGVIAGKGNNTFAPSDNADRAQSSVFIWRMLNLLDAPVPEKPSVEEPTVEEPAVEEPAVEEPAVEEPTVEEPTSEESPVVNPPEEELEYPEGDARNYSYAEIKAMVGEWEVIERRNGDGTVVVRDFIQEYYDRLRDPRTGPTFRTRTPEESIERYYISMLYDTHVLYSQAFPVYELISVNGVTYRESKYFYEGYENPEWKSEERMNNLIANPPKETGKFLIDIGTQNQDVVTYEKNDIEIERLSEKPTASTNDFLVDIKGVFNDTNLVNVSSDGLTVTYGSNVLKMTVGSSQAQLNGKNVTLTDKVTSSNDTIAGPIQSIATTIGLSTRKTDPNPDKIEVANYHLPVVVDGVQVDGWQ